MKVFILCLLISFKILAEDKKPTKDLIWGYAIPNKAVLSSKTNILNEDHPLIILYMKEMKDFKQTSLHATINRIEEEMKNKKLVCYPGSSEYNRRREFSYLTSQYIQPAPQIVVQEELGKKLLAKYHGKINLVSLMNDETIKGALAEGRSYGESIDHLLKNNPSENIKRQVFNTPIQTVIEQIKNGRVDYTLEYPFFVDFMNANVAPKANKLITIPINDADSFVTQYTACSKTPDGIEIIKRIDKIVMKHVGRPEYWKEVLNSVPEKDKEEFKKQMKKFIKDRENTSVIIQ